MSLVPPSSRGGSSAAVYSWLGTYLAAPLVDPTNHVAVWTYPADAIVGSDLTLSGDGKTVTFATTGLYVVSIYVFGIGAVGNALTVNPLIPAADADSYFQIGDPTFVVEGNDAFTYARVTYPPAKVPAAGALTVRFEVNGGTMTAALGSFLWVARIA